METNSENQVFSRKQLYDLIWSMSLTKICNEFSFSYTQLRKICKENEIPIPDNGHWSKLKFGKESNIKALLTFSENEKSIKLLKDKKIIIAKFNHINGSTKQAKTTKNKTLIDLYSRNRDQV